MEVKRPICITMRPALIDKVDELAKQIGQSRSETVGRLLGIFADDLLKPEVGMIMINRDHLLDRTLKV